jgi:D-alanine-D-alanine ligase
MRIVVLYDGAADDWSDEDVRQVVDSAGQIAGILRDAGHQVQCVPVRPGLRWLAAVRRADAVFNLCESIAAVSRYEALVAGTLELTGVPFTGARPDVIALCHRKPVCNALLASRGLPVPRWIVPNGHRVPADFPLPAIVKPAAEDASVGIDQASVVTTRRALAMRVARLSEDHDEVLVQQYVPGRELAVGFVGRRALPLSEIDFSTMPEGTWPILSFSAKWAVGSAEDLGSRPVCPAAVSKTVAERLSAVAREAWTAVGGSGYGRVDLRLDEMGQPWILEVNPNPDIADDAGLSRMAKAAGWSYEDLILRIVDAALSEAQQTQSVALLARGGGRSRLDRPSTGQQPKLA